MTDELRAIDWKPHPYSDVPERFRAREICCGCGADGEYVCDAAIAVRPESHYDAYYAPPHPFIPCKAPLCEDCRVFVKRDTLHDPYTGDTSLVSVDVCPVHTAPDKPLVTDAWGAPRDDATGAVLTDEGVRQLRRRIMFMCAGDANNHRATVDAEHIVEILT